MSRDYIPATLMGRLANGSALDAGQRIHLVPASTGQYASVAVAACGAKPGRTSGGWDVEWPAQAAPNCERCLGKSMPIHSAEQFAWHMVDRFGREPAIRMFTAALKDRRITPGKKEHWQKTLEIITAREAALNVGEKP